MLRKKFKCTLAGFLAVLMIIVAPLSAAAETLEYYQQETDAEEGTAQPGNVTEEPSAAGAGADSTGAPEEKPEQERSEREPLPSESDRTVPQDTSSEEGSQASAATPSDAGRSDNTDKKKASPSDAKRKKVLGADDFIIEDGVLTEYKGTAAEVVIPSGVTKIEAGAFADKRTVLVSVTFDAELEAIESRAFYNFTKLKTADFSASTELQSIGDEAFRYCTKLERAELSSDSTVIGTAAFFGCSSLALVILPSGVSLGDSLYQGGQFDSCTGLTSLSLGSGMTVIPPYAFRNCTGLSAVTLPETVTAIGASAFSGCSSLKTVPVPESVNTIGAYAFKGTAIESAVITSDTLSVGAGVFENCTSLTSFTSSSDGSITFGKEAFKSCGKLNTVTLAQKTVSIGESAFESCPLVEFSSTAAAENITIGEGAFKNCAGLVNFRIAAVSGTVTLDTKAFLGCKKLEAFETSCAVVYSGDSALQLFDGCSALKSVRLGAGTAKVPASMFYKRVSLESVTLPASVTEIGKDAFCGCAGLKSVKTGKSAALSIGECAFDHCTSLASMTVSTSGKLTLGYAAFTGCSALTSLSITANDISSSYGAFTNCQKLASVSINSKTAAFGSGTFSGDVSLKKIKFNSRLNTLSLSDNCFSGCSQLTAFTVPGKLSFVTSSPSPGGQFRGCSALKTVSFESGAVTIPKEAFSGCASLKSVSMPSGVKEIGQRAFKDCTALKSVSIPTTVTGIGNDAFSGCTALTSTGIGSKHTKLTTIGDYAFYNCKKLASFTVPSGVTTLGICAFYGCTALETLTFNSSKAVIGEKAFYDCSALTSVTLPKGVQMSAEGHQFFGCTSLQKAVIGSGIRTIPKCAFSGCTSLTDVVLPKTVNRIGGFAFYGCKQLKNTGLETTTKPVIEEYAYYNCTKLAEVNLPAGSQLDATGFGRQFYFCTSLKKITIGEGMKTIPCYAFTGCYALSGIDLPKSVTRIENYAFWNCKALQDTGLEDSSVTWIGVMAYAGCSSLTEVRLPSTLKSIGGSVFSRSSLKSVTVPASVKSIGEYAFGFENLTMYGYAGSYAQTYAKNNEITFVNIAKCYTARFNGNGAASGYMADVTDMPVSKEKALPANLFKRTGYTFAGWTLNARGTGTVYANKAKVKGLAKAKKSVTLYAKWKANTYKVVLYPNGGKGSSKTVSMTYGKAAKLTNPSYTRSGYIFAGWNTKANGKGTAYPAATAVKNLTTKNGATVKLYAVWVKESIKLSKVAYKAAGSATLSFKKSGTVTGIEIARSTKKTTGFKTVGTAKSSATAYTDTGLKKGTTYYYKVRTYYTYAGVKIYSAYSSVLSYKAK